MWLEFETLISKLLSNNGYISLVKSLYSLLMIAVIDWVNVVCLGQNCTECMSDFVMKCI